MLYIDTSVLLAFTLTREKETEKYKFVKVLIDEINTGKHKAITSFYALHEIYIYALQNAPSFDIGSQFGKQALKNILDTKISIMPLLGRIERKLNAKHFTQLKDSSDLPHAISALVSGCSTIVTYDGHFEATSDILPVKKPEGLVKRARK